MGFLDIMEECATIFVMPFLSTILYLYSKGIRSEARDAVLFGAPISFLAVSIPWSFIFGARAYEASKIVVFLLISVVWVAYINNKKSGNMWG